MPVHSAFPLLENGINFDIRNSATSMLRSKTMPVEKTVQSVSAGNFYDKDATMSIVHDVGPKRNLITTLYINKHIMLLTMPEELQQHTAQLLDQRSCAQLARTSKSLQSLISNALKRYFVCKTCNTVLFEIQDVSQICRLSHLLFMKLVKLETLSFEKWQSTELCQIEGFIHLEFLRQGFLNSPDELAIVNCTKCHRNIGFIARSTDKQALYIHANFLHIINIRKQYVTLVGQLIPKEKFHCHCGNVLAFLMNSINNEPRFLIDKDISIFSSIQSDHVNCGNPYNGPFGINAIQLRCKYCKTLVGWSFSMETNPDYLFYQKDYIGRYALIQNHDNINEEYSTEDSDMEWIPLE